MNRLQQYVITEKATLKETKRDSTSENMENEFVSDTFNDSRISEEELKKEMEQLGMDNNDSKKSENPAGEAREFMWLIISSSFKDSSYHHFCQFGDLAVGFNFSVFLVISNV